MKYSVFYGRWVTFHDGHKHIIKKIYDRDKCPVKIMVRDTDEEPLAYERVRTIEEWMFENHICGKVEMCDDINGIFWGRGVGYKTEEIEVPKDIAEISGTKIRCSK